MTNEMLNDSTYYSGFAQLVNPMMDALYQTRMTALESQVFWFIYRMIDGFGNKKEEKHISIHQFIKRTKIRKENIYRALRNLVENKFIIIANKEGKPAYKINHRYNQWKKAPGVEEITPLKQSGIRSDTESVRSDTESVRTDNNPVSERIPLLHTRGSTERSITHISYSEEREQVGESIDRLIQYAARNCSLTIIGKNIDTLSQLMRRHPLDRIKDAMNHFALYQLEEKEGRRFPIGKTFDAFVRKFDLFTDAESVDHRLADERRWFREHAQPPGKEGLAVSHEPEEDPNELRRQRINFRMDFIGNIEAAAKERGLEVAEMLKGSRHALNRYREFKQDLEEMQNAERTMQTTV